MYIKASGTLELKSSLQGNSNQAMLCKNSGNGRQGHPKVRCDDLRARIEELERKLAQVFTGATGSLILHGFASSLVSPIWAGSIGIRSCGRNRLTPDKG